MLRRLFVLLPLFTLTLLHAQEERPLVHSLFTDNMVLQRGIRAPIWGWAEPGTEIKVTINNRSRSTTAQEDGRWQANLPILEAGGPFQLTVEGPKKEITLKNVMAGDVWICSGQSNMEWSVAASNNAQEEIAAGSHPNVRLFTVPRRVSMTPQETVEGNWSVCSPETVARFSAVGYYFGRQLNRDLDVPIGLIHTSWGGTIAEAWTSAEALETMDDFRPAVRQFRKQAAEMAAGTDSFDQRLEAWWKANDKGTSGSWFGNIDDAAWKSMQLPGNWESRGLPNYDGTVWFRRSVELTAAASGKPGVVSLGAIDDQDTVFINGKRVGGMQQWNAPRSYRIPAGVLKEGTNTVAVRVLDTGSGGGFIGNPDQMKLTPNGATPVSLAGDWKFKPSMTVQQVRNQPRRIGGNPNVTTVLYNGMLAPLVPYGIKGAIWYQGESNAGRAEQYRTLLPTMIRDWRSRFDVGEFPFLLVQLANFRQLQTEPAEGGWATLREAQWLTAAAHPQTGLAVITDIGAANDIHPRNKQDVGRRLALQARSVAYGEDVVAAGPTFRVMTVTGNSVRLMFDSVGGGLRVHGDTLKGFAVAEADGEFVWADARIDGDTVVLSADGVASPMRVRYGWANNPIGILFNAKGLPAGPFRTDLDDQAKSLLSQEPQAANPLPTAKPESVGMSSEVLARIRPELQKYVDAGRVPGAIVAVARKGKLVLFDAVGQRDIQTGAPMQKNSVLRFYSMTKAITSVGVMMLVEEGKVKLDEPAHSYLPELKGMQVSEGDGVRPASRPFTVRDLLRHTSGLTYGIFGSTPVDQAYVQADVLGSRDLNDMTKRLGKLPLLCDPGTQFNYSVSTDVLGAVIERVSGTTLDEYFRQRILTPLRMVDTSFWVPVENQKRFASTHSPLLTGGLSVSDPAWKSEFIASPGMLSGGGGLVSTAHDYLRFCQMLVNGGELEGVRLLKTGTIREMTRNQLSEEAFPISVGGPERPGVGFGLGFSVVAESRSEPHRVGEYGWGGLASTHFWIHPDQDLAVVVLTQHIPFNFQLENLVKPIVYEAIQD